ncbi:MAG TPA: hypothetical protein VF576_04870 [Rubricoccaceae bacterium]|jgi:hypothetical protein
MRSLSALALLLALSGCRAEPPAVPTTADETRANADSAAAAVPGPTVDEADAAADSMEAALEPAEHLGR